MVIKVVTTEEADFGLKIPVTINLLNMEQLLMVMVEVDKFLIPATIPPITLVGMVDFRIYLFLLVLLTQVFMLMIETDIGLRKSTFLTITMAEIQFPNGVSSICFSLGWGSINDSLKSSRMLLLSKSK